MKLNRKGFMLAEVVIVAVMISSILVSLYISVSRMANAYDKRNRYYDIEAMYSAIEINNYLVRENLIETITADGNLQTVLDQGVLNDFAGLLNLIARDRWLINAYYVSYDQTRFNSFKSSNESNEVFSEYLDYLSDQLNFNDNYKYLLIVELKNRDDPDDIYYYTKRVGDGEWSLIGKVI